MSISDDDITDAEREYEFEVMGIPRGKGDGDLYPLPKGAQWVGREKVVVQRTVEPEDKYYWRRLKQAKQLGVDESELEDEPDELPDGSDSQPWEPEEKYK